MMTVDDIIRILNTAEEEEYEPVLEQPYDVGDPLLLTENLTTHDGSAILYNPRGY